MEGIGSAMSESTVGGPAESRPVRRHECGRPGPPGGRFGCRAAAGGRIDAGVPLPRGHAPRGRGGADLAPRGAAHGGSTRLHHPGHHRHAGQPADVRARRPVSEHPVVLPRLDRRHHLRGGHLGRIPRPGHPADGLAGRPLPATAHHRLGHRRLRADGGRDWLRHRTSSCSSWPGSVPAFRSRVRTASTGRCWRTPIRSTCAAGSTPPWAWARAWPLPPAPSWWASSPPRWEAPTAGAGPSTSWPSPLCWWRSSPSAFPSRPAGSSRRRTCSGTSSATHPLPRPRSRPPSSGSCVSARSRRS